MSRRLSPESGQFRAFPVALNRLFGYVKSGPNDLLPRSKGPDQERPITEVMPYGS